MYNATMRNLDGNESAGKDVGGTKQGLIISKPGDIHQLCEYVREAMTYGTIRELAMPAKPENIVMQVKNRYSRSRFDMSDPRNEEIIRREVSLWIGRRYRERMYYEYKFLIETNSELKDLDLEKMGGVNRIF